mmetsp:Transcript_13143/g.55199  ORF Transcript_13143/g.55199 Transcript_13143/m.55199 type:complete len:508 (+) Transcript_13143:683-2206(+)
MYTANPLFRGRSRRRAGAVAFASSPPASYSTSLPRPRILTNHSYVALVVGGVAGDGIDVARHFELREVDLVPQDGTHPAEPLHELAPLLGPIRDKLQRAPKLFVLIRQPLQHRAALDGLQLRARLRVLEVLVVLLLLGREVHDGVLAGLAVVQNVPVDLHVLPHDERLHGTHLEAHQSIFFAEAVLPAVLRDLVEELADELLLLDELDVPERVRGELDGLREPVLAAVRHVHDHEDDGREPNIEQVALHELVLEVRGPSHDEPVDVRAVVRDEVLRREFGDLAHVVLALLQTQARETQRRLPATAVLLGQIDGNLVDHLAVVPRERPEQTAVAVHHHEPVLVVALQELGEHLRVELVVAHVQRRVDGLEGLEVDVQLLLLALIRQHGAAVNQQAVRRHAAVPLQARLRGADGVKHGLPVHARLDVGRRAGLVREHLVRQVDLALGRDHQGDHGRAVAASLLQAFHELADLPHLDLRLILFHFYAAHPFRRVASACLWTARGGKSLKG